MEKPGLNVELWLDVVCPICYIGKRQFELALEKFEFRDNVEVIWKSFQLSRDLDISASQKNYEFLRETKSWSPELSNEANETLKRTAAEAGLEFNLEDLIVVNSFDAHRLIQLSKTFGPADKIVESLFRAHFTEGKDLSSPSVLIEIGKENGIPLVEIKNLFESDSFSKEVSTDNYEAQLISQSGVPFFVINKRYSISGARGSDTFLGALNRSWKEMISE